MAKTSSLTEKELSCLLCCEIYVDPVLLSCRHSFCKECWEEYRQTKKTLKCPLCRKPSPKDVPPQNLQLKTLCDSFLQERNNSVERAETLCNLHHETLKLFCLEDKEPVCIVCQVSKLHSKHGFRPLDEAALERREELQANLKPLQEKLNLFLKAKLICDQTAQHIKKQAQDTKRRIREEFKNLYQFLQDEEEKRLSALRNEKEMKSQLTQKTTSSVNQEILHLSEIITSTHKELAADDIYFLKNYKDTVERTQCTLKDPEIPSGALINVAKHLGNLKFRVWKKMKEMVKYTPVVLDSNTAHHHLSISDDLTSFVCKDEHQHLPENQERSEHHLWVLGSEGFHSGTHSWDTDVENCEQWALGIVTGSMAKGKSFFSGGIWKCNYKNIVYGASSSGGPTTPLRVKENLRKIRVQVDLDRGEVLFSDPISGQILQTFIHRFTETVFPYFCNQCKCSPLMILPKEITVITQQ
ncbi:E3 ubiquitin-protein ligase TRIM35-like [Hoplias malabaricus]|uniref:E3 ubiquitin-protein ligase TRIM35-like n=1 Tax=Hoplias malabaricus TaxID=27720 RepID=UPI0034636502